MSWVKKRIKQYREGQEPTIIEKMALEHGNPVNCFLSLSAFGFLVYGLWTHIWIWIIIAGFLGLLGHLYCWLQK